MSLWQRLGSGQMDRKMDISSVMVRKKESGPHEIIIIECCFFR